MKIILNFNNFRADKQEVDLMILDLRRMSQEELRAVVDEDVDVLHAYGLSDRQGEVTPLAEAVIESALYEEKGFLKVKFKPYRACFEDMVFNRDTYKQR